MAEFVSVFKINGRPILPPAMTADRRKEMQEYKKKAIEIEKRLKESKKGERKCDGVLDHLDEEGDKENNRFSANESRNINSMDVTYNVKSFLSGKDSSKDIIPQFLQKSVEKNLQGVTDTVFGEDNMEEGHSVAFTESTDLHPYLNSSLEDDICSSEAEFISECAPAYKTAPSEESDFTQCKCDIREDSGMGFPAVEPIIDHAASSTSGVYSQETEEAVDTSHTTHVLDSELAVGYTSDQDKGSGLVSSTETSGTMVDAMKILEVDLTTNDGEKVSIVASADHYSNGAMLSPSESNSCENNTADDNQVTPESEGRPTRLIRTDSFTTETPSPLLIAKIEQFTVDALPLDNTVSVGEKNKTFVCCKDKNADQKAFVSSDKSSLSTKDKVAASGVRSEKTKSACQGEGETLKEKNKEPVKDGNRRNTVFERLAADAARKAEERKKLIRKNSIEVFKVPKKVGKTSFRGMRPSLSTSNLRTSVSGAVKNRSDTLANRRTNSLANVSSGKSFVPDSSSQRKSKSLKGASSSSVRKPVVINLRSNVAKNTEPAVASTSEGSVSQLGKEPVCFDTTEGHPLAKSASLQEEDAEKFKESHQKKIMYCVQTSPISPAIPNVPEVFFNAGQALADSDSAETTVPGRKRRRWSLGWSGWVTSVEEQSDSDGGIGSCFIAEPTKSTVCRGESDVELQSTTVEDSSHVSEIEEVTAPHDEEKCDELSQSNAEKVHADCQVRESLDHIPGSSGHFDEKSADQSMESGTSCGIQSGVVDLEELVIPLVKEVPYITTSESNNFLEKNVEGPLVDSSVSNDESVKSCETISQPVLISPSLEKKLSSLPSSPAGSVGVEETALKISPSVSVEKTLCSVPSSVAVSLSVEGTPSKISPSVEKTLSSLPSSPAGSVGVKETALKLLSCLVEEQDKAMARLLEDQRVQAERMRERFMLQQKCLVERVAHLVNSLSTPPIPKSISKSHHDEDAVANGKDSKTPSMSSPQLSHERTLPHVTESTPRSTENFVKQLPHRTCSSDQDLLEKLKFGDILEEKASKDVANELESTLIKMSLKEGFAPAENSICQACLKPMSNCHCCSTEESSYSSTIRGDVTALSVDSVGNVTVTATATSEVESRASVDEVVSSPLQEANKLSTPSPNKLVVKESVNPSINVTVREDLLDLSEILEMELGCKSANTNNQTPSTRMDKAKENAEEIYGVVTLSSTPTTVTISDHEAAISGPQQPLSSFRQMYEQDLLRLKPFESKVERERLPGVPLTNEPVTPLRDGTRNPDKLYCAPNATPCKLWMAMEYERRGVPSDVLPVLKSDVLQAYLGSQTPSTGPVFVQTPLASASSCQSQELPACSTPAELLETAKLSVLPLKEVESQCGKEGSSSTLVSPVARESREGEEVSPSELHLSIRSSSSCSSSTSYPHDLSQPSSAINRSLNNSHSSGQYTTASSMCLTGKSTGREKQSMLKFEKLSALVKGYLTRRLLKTEKVQRIKMTIRDLILAALKLHSEISQDDNVNQHDVALHGQILAELNASCEDFHRIFFEMTTAQQMALISADRRRLMSSASSSTTIIDEVKITPRPALLSAVTLKTLQRRISMYSPDNKPQNVLKPKRTEEQANQVKFSSVCAASGQKGVNGRIIREPVGRRSTNRTKSISEGIKSISVRTTMGRKISVPPKGSASKNKSDMQTNTMKRKRRSRSAGDTNRRPWR
ncbi:uncharacterized protein LOC124165478 [Ischnura elegans]|uniref:uncharacterized protein LOC124165478 n=1 Tax=Ischnura elegans TaxID=197161 RepID=UPI001ED866E1|nr:uncharacterized protein LOC124165478 [Ischnura elegans]